MATLASSVVTKYQSLTSSLFPGGTRWPIYYGLATSVDSSGNQLVTDYVVFETPGGMDTTYQTNAGGWEGGMLTMEVISRDTEKIEAVLNAIRFNGQPPANKAGFDWGSLTLGNPFYLIQMVKGNDQLVFVQEDGRGIRKYKGMINWKIKIGINPALTPEGP